ncbi:Transmembrane protein 45B [Chelonia mydas]|uniref:Transmembrane protein 45B n=1 Tax=Chelonia mydas TaxID=8469 RepID=M7BH17_CHEMY|nr:Transmembrane protein 45B [Chelonia mydas]
MLGLWWSLNYPLMRLNKTCCTNRCYQSLEFVDAAGKLIFSFVDFLFHLHVCSRSALQQHVHLLLIAALGGDALSLWLEVFIPRHPCPAALQHPCSPHAGSRFRQILFVLYPPWEWLDGDQTDDGNIMLSTRCVCWHYAATLLIVVFNDAIVFWHELGSGGKVGE